MEKVKSFPGMPQAAGKLLSLLNNPKVSVNEIEELLRYDPGLTANVLKLANSAYFGLPSKIGSVKQAVVLLGSKKLIQLVLASCVHGVMDKPVPGYDLPSGGLWRHSVAVAVTAEALVKELKITSADIIFTAALLHDVGKLALGEFVQDDMKKIQSAVSDDISFEIAEQNVLGTHHAEVGELILKNWFLPSEILCAVKSHHTPDDVERPNQLIDIVHVADVLCLMIGIGMGAEGLQYQLSDAAIERLGLKPFQLEKIASQTLQWVGELSDVLQGAGAK
jgi:putative nucleotidyltransferase with HDIG domain